MIIPCPAFNRENMCLSIEKSSDYSVAAMYAFDKEGRDVPAELIFKTEDVSFGILYQYELGHGATLEEAVENFFKKNA